MNQKKKLNYGYYAALVVGLVALLVLVGVYTTNQALQKEEQYVDLNGTKDETGEIADVDSKAAEAKNSDAKSEQANAKDDVVSIDDNALTADADSKDTEKIGSSDLAKAEIAKEQEIGKEEETVKEDTKETLNANANAKNAATKGFTKNSKLSWPVTGSVILPYSMDTTVYYKTLDTYKCNPGMLITAEVGTPVYAAYAGTVTKIEQSAEYGTLIHMDLGNGYEAQYGQLADVSVSEGQTVAAGAAIGNVAKPTDMYQLEGANLFFSLSEEGQMVDPEKFLP